MNQRGTFTHIFFELYSTIFFTVNNLNMSKGPFFTSSYGFEQRLIQDHSDV